MQPTTRIRLGRHLPTLVCVAIGYLALCTRAGAEASESSVPYAVIYRALEPALAIDAYPRLRAIKRIESKQPGVSPASIRLTIARAAGTLEIRPAADGTIEFPLDAALLAENPLVYSNQPRGSLVLSATLALTTPPTRALPPAMLTAALDDANRLLGADGQGERAIGVELRFATSSEATVTLRGASERVLVADAAGRIVLLRDRDLGAPTELVELSHVPTLIVPRLGGNPAAREGP